MPRRKTQRSARARSSEDARQPFVVVVGKVQWYKEVAVVPG